jgi:hypothetical protein
MKATLESIFETAENGRHFTNLLEKEGLTLYQRGKQHGVISEDGTKYRFSRLGLAEEWEALDKRMMENLQQHKTAQDTLNTAETPQQHRRTDNRDSFRTQQDTQNTQQQHAPEQPKPQEAHTMKPKPQPETEQRTANVTSPAEAIKELLLHPLDNPIQQEIQDEEQRRLEEAKAMRTAKATNQASTGQRNSNKNQQ